MTDNLRYLLLEDYWHADCIFDAVGLIRVIRGALDGVLTEDDDDALMARVHAAYEHLADVARSLDQDDARDEFFDALEEFFKAANYTPPSWWQDVRSPTPIP